MIKLPNVLDAIHGWEYIDKINKKVTEYEPAAGNAGIDNPVGSSLRNADKL